MAGLALALVSMGEARADDKECMTAASSGQELRDKGQLLDARGRFQTCAQTECPAPIPSYCVDWLNEIGRKIPTLVIRVIDDDDRDVPDAVITLDDRPLALDGRPVEVDPGKHHVRITRTSAKSVETDIIAAQGEKDRTVVVKLVPEEPPPPPVVPRVKKPFALENVPTPSWIAWGVGAAGLVTFSVFGLKAKLDYDGYQSTCGNHCTFANRDSVARSVTVADVGLIVGLLGAGVGTALFLLKPNAAAEQRAASTSTSHSR
jgi:hypothetical protein